MKSATTLRHGNIRGGANLVTSAQYGQISRRSRRAIACNWRLGYPAGPA
jgi:hypothetical protein